MEKFKVSNKYSNKLCDYYVEGFELFRKYLAKHYPAPSLIWKKWRKRSWQIVLPRPTVENEVVLGVVENVLIDLSPSSLP